MGLNRHEKSGEQFLKVCAEEFKETLTNLNYWVYLLWEVSGFTLIRSMLATSPFIVCPFSQSR